MKIDTRVTEMELNSWDIRSCSKALENTLECAARELLLSSPLTSTSHAGGAGGAAESTDSAAPPAPPAWEVILTAPEDSCHGDLSTNLAFLMAKPLRQRPSLIAEKLAERVRSLPFVQEALVAGAGFLNVILHPKVWYATLYAILREESRFGHATLGGGQKVNVEFFSANPTGPAHAGHGRGAVLGDILANLLEAVGYDVTREFYINDGGNQAEILARSTQLHYAAILEKRDAVIPEGMYPAPYVRDIAAALIQRDGDRWMGMEESQWLEPIQEFATHFLMEEMRAVIDDLGIRYDRFVSEKLLQKQGKLDEALALLEKKGLVDYQELPTPRGMEDTEGTAKQPLLVFRSTLFGDDQDRPLKRANGSWTYFAGDAAYHLDKFRRGFSRMITVWGADHGSHVTRMKAVVEALSDGQAHLSVILCQMVSFFDKGVPVKMSKRQGTFVTIADILESVGRDLFRFFLITRKPETHFDFDFQKVLEESKDNPVFYIQYAHARCCSVLRAAEDVFTPDDVTPHALSTASWELLGECECELIKILADWPRQMAQAAAACEPHRLALHLHRISVAFHSLWQQGKTDSTLRFIQKDNPEYTKAVLGLVYATACVIRSGLGIFGVRPLHEMR